MRTRTLVAGLTLALAASTAAGGCQIIAELNTLQVVGTGGAGPTSTGPTTGSTGSAAGCQCTDGFGCVAGGTTCNTTCTQDSECAKGYTCAPAGPGGMPASQCLACGGSPMGRCMEGGDGGCASCDGQTCVTTCSAGAPCTGTSSAPFVVDATMAPARLTCDSTCTGSTILCVGVFPCEVDCPMGSGGPTCGTKTTIECGGGPCTLACDMMGCAGVTLQCADNACVGTYYVQGMVPAPIISDCGNACSCSVGEADAGP
jgi:hypothetical protein